MIAFVTVFTFCNMNIKRYGHASTVLKDALFITGGRDSGNNVLASTEFVYSNGTVEVGIDMPLARYGHCMVTLHDGKVMILGAEKSIRRNTLIYDPANNSYTNGPSLSYDRRHAACTVFNSPMHNDRPVILAAGGTGETSAELYDYTNANQWQTSKYTSQYF